MAETRTGVVVVTHGEAALSMVEAAEKMVGKLDVEAVAVGLGEERVEIERRIGLAIERLDADDILFLVDLEGSTPYNLCCRRCREVSVVLSGMNLPMLFKLSTADRTRGAQALAEELAATGVRSIHIHLGESR